jgi:acyl-CoA reductase-like NAD-dependent aldehyde dehydrogenase
MSDKRVLHNFIDGSAVEPADGRYADLIDPSTGEVFAAAPVSGDVDVDRAMKAAEKPSVPRSREAGLNLKCCFEGESGVHLS